MRLFREGKPDTVIRLIPIGKWAPAPWMEEKLHTLVYDKWLDGESCGLAVCEVPEGCSYTDYAVSEITSHIFGRDYDRMQLDVAGEQEAKEIIKLLEEKLEKYYPPFRTTVIWSDR